MKKASTCPNQILYCSYHPQHANTSTYKDDFSFGFCMFTCTATKSSLLFSAAMQVLILSWRLEIKEYLRRNRKEETIIKKREKVVKGEKISLEKELGFGHSVLKGENKFCLLAKKRLQFPENTKKPLQSYKSQPSL